MIVGTNDRWQVGLLWAHIAMVAFALPHFVDDFLYGVPAEFGLTDQQAQILGGIFFGIWTFVIAQSARGQRSGYIGAILMSAFLVLAASVKHLDGILLDAPYWGGLISELSILGLIVSGIAVMTLAVRALRACVT
jgi:hypothetical protein